MAIDSISSPFGDGFGFAVKTACDYDEAALYPEEMALLSAKAVKKRRIEFCIGRIAAHSALRDINIDAAAVLKGPQHEPVWPGGVAGAISHSDGLALAAVAPKERAAGIGIDIEIIDANVSRDIVKEVCTPGETAWVKQRDNREIERLFMVFSAKESIFKAFFPIEHIFLDYQDAELVWQENTGNFGGKLLARAGTGYEAGYPFEVGCRKIGRYIFTFMSLPPVREPAP
ncbi:4'-phosphopantetheinyl transferase [Acetonema longum DSM 6540]|uniref:4'-phosphopantetheinyl transferase n=1 Tax=Acetonema longum DSM 6540 TaxID=1009370 RepID=F7NDT1_9FIRM|nr:4'-phosphopantetheinyl transferase superfamily protein [Acetonema longum]EGO65802.1 4'-phosphopantetheinyl transferase [Acetonema longum DSM 6540]